MEFAAFADRAADIEVADADTQVVAAVTTLLSDSGEDLPVVARFVQGRVFPGWASRTLDVGPSLCREAIARAAGPDVDPADVEDRLADRGEIGAVAASYDFGGQRGLSAFGDGGDALTVARVAAELDRLAAAEGAGSRDTKVDVLFGLFNRCSPTEARYLARLVLSEMRIGVGGGSVRDAIADAFDVHVEAVERALQVSNDFGRVAVVARADGRDGLDAMQLRVGRPVRAMLAQAGTTADALEEWGQVGVEWKFDGARVQVHYDPDGLAVDARDPAPAAGVGGVGGAVDGPDGASDGGGTTGTGDRTVALYSRNMEDVTDPLPEVVDFVEEHCTGPAILDGEVVAVDADGEPRPFQAVLRRFHRKHDVAVAAEEVPLQLWTFDCLHAGGEDLLEAPLSDRREHLEAIVEAGTAEFAVTDDTDRIEAIDEAALAAGHEGIMLKNPESAYTPGRRGRNWLKRKPDVETLDLVVTGAEWGEGRRAQLLGTFLLSARVADDGAAGHGDGDGDGGTAAGSGDGRSATGGDDGTAHGGGRTDDGFATIGKVATGITDEELADLTELLEPHVRSQSGTEVDIEPAVVFEVGYEEIQRSPTYSSGFALRFPRFRAVRDDLDPADADSLARVRRLAEDQ